jgi:hypothetical protein
VVDPELARFIESGVSVIVATRNARLEPECVRAVGAWVAPCGEDVQIFVPVSTGFDTAANLLDNGRIAVTFSRPQDHQSYQVKGRLLELRAASEAERDRVEIYRALLVQALGFVGIPPRLTSRVGHWPCHSVIFRIESLFFQTPGPKAGQPLLDSTGRAAS